MKAAVPMALAAGLVAGWVLHGLWEPAPEIRREGGEAVAPAAAKFHHDRDPQELTKWQSRLRGVDASDEEEVEAFARSIGASERGAALEALAKEAGPEGLDYDLRQLMTKVLADWTKEDFKSAWAWAEVQQPPALRSYLREALVDCLADVDPDRAQALYIGLAEAGEPHSSGIAFKILGEKSKHGATGFLEAMERFASAKKVGFGGTEMDFPEDFDFRMALDGLRELDARHGGGAGGSPSNMLSTWVTRDREAAHAWWAANGRLTYEAWGEMLNALSRRDGEDVTMKWAAAKLQEEGAPRMAMIEELGGWMGSGLGNTDKIRAIAAELPDEAIRQAFLSDAIASAGMWINGELHQAVPLVELSSAELRLETLRKAAESGPFIHADQIDDKTLAEWEITRAQLEDAVKR